MDKVKVNKYQKEHLDAFMERYNRGEITASLTVSLEKLADAIKYGYEVEPEFVSFEEAMKALKEAKAVYFHDEEWKTRVTYGAFLEDTDLAVYTLVGLVNGKWSIGSENK